MQMVQPAEFELRVLTAAVTPVVLVSAAAILVSAVNSRYISISDRMRALAQEYRDVSTLPHRRAVIACEMMTFKRRVRLVSWAERMLYAAVACFTSVALFISATSWRHVLVAVSLPVFTLGIVLVMTAILLQLLELQLSNRTLFLDTMDVAPPGKEENA
jgi:DNA-binding transcriptional regulator YbjK